MFIKDTETLRLRGTLENDRVIKSTLQITHIYIVPFNLTHPKAFFSITP